MNRGKAIAIFKDIFRADLSDEERGTAIKIVLQMETKNSITKKDMVEVMRYLWHMVFTETEDYETGDTETVIR